MDKSEILRYLGYKNQYIDENTGNKIQQCVREIIDIASEKYIYDYFIITGRNASISLNHGAMELQGKSIAAYLNTSKECVLMAATLGSRVDQRIRYYEKTDMARALILDACATAYVEELCDKVCHIIENELPGKYLNYRFSPGYGDLPITIQKNFLRVLDAEKKIGLTASESSILLPRKSVTAIAGIVEAKCKSQGSCAKCEKTDCEYRREDK